MKILNYDKKRIVNDYPEAAAFIFAAELRYECLVLTKQSEFLTNNQQKRLEELLNSPACKDDVMFNKIDSIIAIRNYLNN